MEQDYYSILQVSPDAESAVIEGAYLHLTQKYHPDLNASPDAYAQMNAINEAYDILSDPHKRAVYDRKRIVYPDSVSSDTRWRAFIQILDAEQNHGYKDDTLMGGLDAYAQLWARRFGDDTADSQMRAASVAAFLKGYAEMSHREREQAIAQATARAKNEPIPPYRIARANSLATDAAVTPSLRFGRYLKYILVALVLIALGIAGSILVRNWMSGTSRAQENATDRCPQGCTTPPPGCQIKGNINSGTNDKIYHLPDDEFYNTTTITPSTGERWFCLEEEAVANGWRHARR